MDDLFARKKRKSPYLLAGAIGFGLLAAASFVDAARDTPMVFATTEVTSAAERVAYRVGAGLFCTLMAFVLYQRAGEARPGEKER